MDNELIAAIVSVLLSAEGWLKSHSKVTDKLNFYG